MKNPGMMRRKAVELGFDRLQADRLVKERPDDLERWVEVGHVPPSEAEQPRGRVRLRTGKPDEKPKEKPAEPGKDDAVPKPRKRP